jgi:UDP-glucose 4-epimerase
MNVLITGGCGFIGSHLAEAMVRRGDKVTIFDSLQLNVGMLSNIRDVAKDIRFIRGDIRDFNAVRDATMGVEAVYHLSAISHLPFCRSNPLQAAEVNLGGTYNVLEACRVNGVGLMMLAGTDHVYGEPGAEELPVTEDYPYRPTDTYALTKVQSMQLCTLYHNIYGLDTRVLLSSNVFGERQDGTKAVPIFAKTAWKNYPISINGGEQSRQFYYVGDLVEAYLLVAEKGKAGEKYNVAGSREVTVRKLVDMVVRSIGSQSPIVVRDYRVDESPNLRLVIDTRKIRELGWTERVGFEAGLARTLEWYRENGY